MGGKFNIKCSKTTEKTNQTQKRQQKQEFVESQEQVSLLTPPVDDHAFGDYLLTATDYFCQYNSITNSSIIVPRDLGGYSWVRWWTDHDRLAGPCKA